MNTRTAALLIAFASVTTLATAPATAQDTPPPETVKTAPAFVMMAGVSNEFEIRSSELALQKSGDEAIRTFAQQMVADHDKAGIDMVAALEASEVDLLPPAALDPPHQAKLDALSSAEGAAFDELYVDQQVEAHDAAVALFTGYSEGGDDEALRQFAAKTLPTLRMHQEHVQALDAQ